MNIEKLRKAENFNKLFQGVVILVSNHCCGVKITPNFYIQPIMKSEGGGVINGREIVFTKYHQKPKCYDDLDYKRREESDITELVIENLLDKVDWEEETIQEQIEEFIFSEKIDLPPEDLYVILSKFTNNPFGDPLRSFFRY